MFSRIRVPQGLPSIRRPRVVAPVVALALSLSASTAFAQRGACGGVSGGVSGSSGATSGAFSAGGAAGNGQMNPMAMMSSAQFMQPRQGMQGQFFVPSMIDDSGFDGDHRTQLATRKAIREAELQQRRAELQALRPERKPRVTSTRTVTSTRAKTTTGR